MPPIGALWLAGTLDKAGVEWSIVDTQFDNKMHPFAASTLAAQLTRSKAQDIGISLFSDSVPLTIAALELAAPELAGKRVFLGGPGVVGIARPLLARLPMVDAVVVGEGETALAELVSGDVNKLQMPGIYRRGSNDEIVGAGRTVRQHLDDLPWPAWSWCENRGYDAVGLSSMRGCPFSCEFCEIIQFMGRRVTTVHVGRAIDEMQTAVNVVGTRRVDILDDTFTVNRRRVLEFCEEVRYRKLDVEFSIFSRTDTLDDEMMERLADAGCTRVFFGVDAGDDDILRRITKGIRVADAVSTITRAADFFNVTASFIWGYPFELLESVERTVALARSLRDHAGRYAITPQLHLLTPSAGTPLFEKYGQNLVLDWRTEGLLGGALATKSRLTDDQLVRDVIVSDRVLAAPFYRFACSDFELKVRLVAGLTRDIDSDLGREVAGIFDE